MTSESRTIGTSFVNGVLGNNFQTLSTTVQTLFICLFILIFYVSFSDEWGKPRLCTSIISKRK